MFRTKLIIATLFILFSTGCVKENRVANESETTGADSGPQNVDGQNDGGIDNQGGNGGMQASNADAGPDKQRTTQHRSSGKWWLEHKPTTKCGVPKLL